MKTTKFDAVRAAMIGARFERLTVVEFAGVDSGRSKFHCVCECGREVRVAMTALKTGNTTSCGCIRGKHHRSYSKLYSVWTAMRKRCSYEKDRSYKNYGGRGIKVCERWQEFTNFAADMGDPPPGLSIDRIDNNGDYEPGNCRWATRLTQQNNLRTNRIVEFDGQCLTVAEWSRRTGLPPHVLKKRINNGWSTERALTTPKMEQHSHGRA